MRIFGFGLSLALFGVVLVDAFETILQPRRVTHRFRYARLYYRWTWALWRAVGVHIARPKRREAFLSWFGPLSMLGLFATWIIGLLVAFALLQWSLGTPLHAGGERVGFLTHLYLSGATLLAAGYGDVVPVGTLGRMLAVAESGLGLAFLAVIVSYLPVLFQAFSRREVVISLLDARAGSPPTAGEFLLRLARAGNFGRAEPVLAEWERWAAELLESHLSFPVLSFYRSQHDNQSWLAALSAILDACALLLAEVKEADTYQAQLTFAMARHAAVDLALIFHAEPVAPIDERLPREAMERVREALRQAGVAIHDGPGHEARLAELRGMYEPFIETLGRRLMLAVPPVAVAQPPADNWQRSAWMPRTPGIGSLPAGDDGDEHF
jgi:hypothetical protein